MKLRDKITLVTGAASGIGSAIAQLFAEEGAVVFAADITTMPSPQVPRVETIALDVTREQDWSTAIETIVARHGRLDVLVNNAGIIAYEAIHELELEHWSRLLAVDQTGVFLGMRGAIRVMRRQASGAIVNISSIWGSAAVAGAHAYHAAKGAVRNMTKNAAVTYATEGIRINSVHPGFIDTALTRAQAADLNARVIASTPMKRAGTPVEVARGCVYLASDDASYVTGAELVIDGGYLAQ